MFGVILVVTDSLVSVLLAWGSVQVAAEHPTVPGQATVLIKEVLVS
jgi:hypothetical protein